MPETNFLMVRPVGDSIAIARYYPALRQTAKEGRGLLWLRDGIGGVIHNAQLKDKLRVWLDYNALQARDRISEIPDEIEYIYWSETTEHRQLSTDDDTNQGL